MADPQEAYHTMKGDLQKVLALPLEGREEEFCDFVVGYLMVKHGYSEDKALRLVKGNQHAILVMLLEEDEPPLG